MINLLKKNTENHLLSLRNGKKRDSNIQCSMGRRTEPSRIVPKRALMMSFEGIPLMTLYLNSVDEIMNSEETMQ